ncbi:MAG: hypothetical protein DMF93_10670 [Acidobacteria bacterium]|nr:MAG: hypothetical protein DMF93_10670 [Acidobacteriota bacterium]
MKATHARTLFALAVVLAAMLSVPIASAQAPPPRASAPRAEPEPDALGRESPRGTVIRFMAAARTGNVQAAALYLNTDRRDEAAAELAQQLYVVLDSRLPARLNTLSDRPEGSIANPLKPDQDVVGTISAEAGPLDVVVERVDRGKNGRVWLFSRRTLKAIPEVYDEIHLVAAENYLPAFLTRPRIAGIRLFEWLLFFLAIPLLYRIIGLFGVLIGPAVNAWRRRHGLPDLTSRLLPGPIRILLLAAAIRWLLATVDLPLFERQFWAATARVLSTTALVWLALLVNAFVERYVRGRAHGTGFADMAALLRLVRRVADVLVVTAGALIVLAYFGIDPTAALAGLGIGGIAVALAAQKTLENVIGGVSIIFDRAVRVGDFLKLGDTIGTVDYIGLRSTRIRTLDRTILSVPNGQIATLNVETLSARDMFWFHHFVALRYETSAAQLRGIVGDFRDLLRDDRRVDPATVRARLVRLGPFSFDVEVFAYIYALDWNHFLEQQEALLMAMMEIVERRGATIALPTQTIQFSGAAAMPVTGGAERSGLS